MFLIPPFDLQDRRNRCRSQVRDLMRLAWETVSSCNVCSSRRNVIISTADRYGFSERTALCLDCGLIYLMDRLTADSYAQFYSDGSFRNISSQFNKVTHTLSQIQSEQRNYAETLCSVLGGYQSSYRHGNLLDIGGSAGVVSAQFAKKFDLSATVLDPAEEEVRAARALGLGGVVGSVEEYDTDEKYDLILLCRSIEHLMDLRTAFSRIRRLLKPGGHFYCDLADFVELCHFVGPPETVAKIDHCYWLTQSTALDIFRALGFEVVSMNIVFGFGYAGYLLRASEPKAIGCVPEERIQKLIEQIHRIQFEWTVDTSSNTISHSLRLKAYRMKRRVLQFAGLGGADSDLREPLVTSNGLPIRLVEPGPRQGFAPVIKEGPYSHDLKAVHGSRK
jgi:SAM-dependent methyltransferase